jgi:hypothetical protein
LREIAKHLDERSELKHLLSCRRTQERLGFVVASENRILAMYAVNCVKGASDGGAGPPEGKLSNFLVCTKVDGVFR